MNFAFAKIYACVPSLPTACTLAQRIGFSMTELCQILPKLLISATKVEKRMILRRAYVCTNRIDKIMLKQGFKSRVLAYNLDVIITVVPYYQQKFQDHTDTNIILSKHRHVQTISSIIRFTFPLRTITLMLERYSYLNIQMQHQTCWLLLGWLCKCDQYIVHTVQEWLCSKIVQDIQI